MAGKPNVGFYAVVGLVVAGLIGFAVYQAGIFGPKLIKPPHQQPIDPNKLTGGKTKPKEGANPQAEEHSDEGITTVKEVTWKPSERLPEVKGTAGYDELTDNTVRFALNVWAGWAPIIYANNGFKPEKVWKTQDGKEFKVELVLIDNPIQMRDVYARGQVHIGWATLDMLPLFVDGFVDTAGKPKDSRIMPRVFQQIDWSSGGDGIVVRDHITNVAALKGKTVTLAQNSPSQYYLTSLLLSAGLKPSDVKTKYTEDAFMAAAAFVSDKSVDACVTWAPDIYTIPEKVKKTRILSSTKEANKLIADVYAIRADFVRDHPDIVEGLVAGIFEGMDMVKKDPAQPCAWLADAFTFKPEEVLGMQGDFQTTNFADNVQFFLNASNPTNFERTWKNAGIVYRTLGSINTSVEFDKVMDFSFVQALQKKGTFASHQEVKTTFAPVTYKQIQAEAPILTQTIRINFYPNSSNPFEPARDELGSVVSGKFYDPNAKATLEQVARLAGQFDRATILIEGHTDSSMKGKVPLQAVKDLSLARAQSIKQALIRDFKFDENKFAIEGKGWERPFDENENNNHVQNRRVEISVYSPEQK